MNTTLRRVLIGAGVLLSIGVIAVIAMTVWLGSDDAPDAFEVSDAPASTSPADPTDGQESDGVDVDGTWQVELLDGSDAGVGYRILEDVPIGGPEEVVARTQTVTGTLEIADGELTSAEVTVDMGSLRSSNQLRDDIVAADYLEVPSFPTATLVITDPAGIPLPEAVGEQVSFDVEADLTIHGVTRSVTVPGDGLLVDDAIEIVGTVDILLTDFDVTPPDLLGRTVRDEAVVEFKLRFVPA